MSACSRSDAPARAARLLLASLAVLALAAPAARADTGTDGDTTRARATRVDIGGGHGIVIDEDAAIVRVLADATVEKGERVDGDVVAILGSVDVRGEVSGNVVAVGGSVRLAPGASVDGDAVAIGGVLDQAPGAKVSGESVSLGFLPMRVGVPTLPILLGLVLVGWLLNVFGGWLMVLIAPERTLRIAATASRRTGLSLVVGLVLLPGVIVASMLLMVTIVGIPVAILLPILHAVALGTGFLAATALLGSRLARRPLEARSAVGAIAIGNLFVAVFFAAGALLAGPAGIARTFALFSTALGALLVLGLSLVGSGAVLVSKLGAEPKDVGAEAAPGPAAAPGPLSPPAPAGA